MTSSRQTITYNLKSKTMKTKDILIATALILTISSLLTGCKLIETQAPAEQAAKPAPPKINLEKTVKKALAVKKEVDMVLTAEKSENQVTVIIALENPQNKSITSIQSWLSFDATKLQGKEINTSGSAFELMAPYDNTFDNENGLVMIGRSNPDPIIDSSIQVVEVIFDIIAEGAVMIDTYDYREDLTGHTSVNTIVENKPYNILKNPDSPALIIEN